MNVNVAEHQRSILAAMGIDLWIPKADVQTRHYQNTLYRDVAQAEQVSTQAFEFSHSDNLTQTKTIVSKPKNELQQTEKVHSSEVSLLRKNVETQQIEEISSNEQIQKQTVFNVEPALQIEPFEIQAFCSENCVILVDCTQINADQKMLWTNIQRAVPGQYYDLKWPFPMLQFQDGKGAAMYIQGFVDAIKQERRILSLGQLMYLNSSDVIQLASLQDMIDQPILKRRLWQFMQNKGH